MKVKTRLHVATYCLPTPGRILTFMFAKPASYFSAAP